MSPQDHSTSTVRTARMAGLAYLLQIPLGIFGVLYVPNALVVSGNLGMTASNILSHELLFRLSMVSAILCSLDTIVTAFLLYKLLKSVNRIQAISMLAFTVVVAPIAMINELNHAAVLVLLKSPDYAALFSVTQLQGLLSLFLNLHTYGIQIVGIFWGLWLFPMGYLVFKSTFIPKVIGVLLIIGCLAYLVDFATFFTFPQFDMRLTQYTFLGEILMVLWLLIRGVNVERWKKHSVE